VRDLRGIDIKRFLPVVEMTVDAFLTFAITSNKKEKTTNCHIMNISYSHYPEFAGIIG